MLVAEGKSFALGDFTGGTAVVPEETPEATPSLGAGALGINGLTRTSAGPFDFGIYTPHRECGTHRILVRSRTGLSLHWVRRAHVPTGGGARSAPTIERCRRPSTRPSPR